MSTVDIPKRGDGFFVSGGTLPLESESYVERDCDRALFAALRDGKYCYVLNSRQMGKSSLSIRTLARLEDAGWSTVSLDLTQMGGRNVTAEQWYLGLAAELGRCVGLRSQVLGYCRQNAEFGPMRRFFGAIRDVVLEAIDRPVVICIDEIDATRNLAFDTDEFFAGIRDCYNRRAHDPIYERLTFCILGVAVPSDLIRNPTTTPFNIGERVYLRDFTLEEVRPLARGLGPNGEAIVARIHHWTNGHPFLTQSLCAAIAADPARQSPAGVDRLVETEMFGPKARDRNVNLSDVANRALNSGAHEPDPERFRADLLSVYGRALAGKPVPDDEGNRVASLLKLSGLVRSDGMRLRVRNRIYERVFDSEWIRENMPGQELVRLRQSFRRGLLRATLVSGVILVGVSGLGLYAWRSQLRAEAATAALDLELYVAAMNNLRIFEENGDIARIAQTLERTRNSPHRDFEWGLWQSRLHDAKEEYTLDYFAPGKRESGLLSWDARLVCVVDEVTLTATVVERRTRNVVCSHRIGSKQVVVPKRDGFLLLDPTEMPATVRDLESLRLLGTLGSSENPINEFVVRPDSPFVLALAGVGGKDGDAALDLYDLRTLRKVTSVVRPNFRFESPTAFAADGSRIVFAPFEVPTAPDAPPRPTYRFETLDTASGRIVDRFTIPSSGDLFGMSADGRYLVYGDGATTTLGRDLGLRRTIYRRAWPPGEAPSAACFSPRADILATLDRTGRTIVEEFPTGRLLGTRSNVWSLGGITAASELVASATSVRIFDVRADSRAPVAAKGERLGRNGKDLFVAFQPNSTALVRLSDPHLKPLAQIPDQPSWRNFTYNGCWQSWASPDGKTAYFSETFGDRRPRTLPFYPSNFSGGISPHFVAALNGKKREVVGMDGATGKALWRFPLPESSRSGLWVSPNGDRVLAFVGNASVVILDSRDGHPVGRLDRHNIQLNNVTFTADGKGFFTCGVDGRAILWDLATCRARMEFQGNAARGVIGADLSPDGRRAVTANDAGSWQLWDAATGVQLAEVKAAAGSMRNVMFTADGKRVLGVGEDRTIRMWEAVDHDPSFRIPISDARRDGIRK
ncbi:MAG: AAA-like domain-containing protein [Fimbriimonas sp.]